MFGDDVVSRVIVKKVQELEAEVVALRTERELLLAELTRLRAENRALTLALEHVVARDADGAAAQPDGGGSFRGSDPPR